MNANNDEAVKVLQEIRDILSRIYVCFEDDYLEIQRRKLGEKLSVFEDMLTPTRRKIYPLLFDPRQLSQVEMADEANTSQPTVSRFISALLDEGFIEQREHEDGNTTYRDKYDLAKLIQD